MTVEVVAAAIVRDGKVLAARRSAPSRLAGGWEFPGGKIEPGETPAEALVRECREELGVTISAGARLGAAADDGVAMTLLAAVLAPGAEPLPLQDHDDLVWLGGAELGGVAWLPIDLALLPAVRPLLVTPAEK